MNEDSSANMVIPLIDRLARIEEKLDRMREDRMMADTHFTDIEKRIDRVERFMWVAVGLAMASGVTNLAALYGG